MRLGFIALLAGAFVFGGCATTPQQPLQLHPDAIGAKGGKVGVAMSALPKVDTSFPGAGCLLCMAAASAANASLTNHARTLPVDDLKTLKAEVADLLRRKGTEVVVIEEELDIAKLPNLATKSSQSPRKDFSALGERYQIDRILVIEIARLGFVRNYSAYIPNEDPRSIVEGAGYIVDLRGQVLDWYAPVSVTRASEQNWDEPPKFPGLTNAYFFALETSKDAFLAPFKD